MPTISTFSNEVEFVLSGAKKLNSCLPYPEPEIFQPGCNHSTVIELAIATLIGVLLYISNAKSFSPNVWFVSSYVCVLKSNKCLLLNPRNWVDRCVLILVCKLSRL